MSANHTNSVVSTQKRMLGDISVAKNIYIACGYTDMRKSIDGLAAIILQQFKMDPFQSALFLFCGKRCNRIKALLWKKMALYCYISVWRMAVFAGHAMKVI